VIDAPGEHPLPHLELHTQAPIIFSLRKGAIIYRHHQKAHNPVFFGSTGNFRFDDPDSGSPGCFGVLYAGDDPECCLLESCGPTTGVPSISVAYLAVRSIARLELSENLRMIDLVEAGGLTRIGADSRLTTGSYAVSQQWSASLRNHPIKPDGIRYRSRHAPERIAYAIYSRSQSTFLVSSMGSFTDPANEALLRVVLKTYKVSLI
jgi:RES domain